MSLLERSFVAITTTNVYITFNDVESWIKQHGVRYFLRTFGISHMPFKVPMARTANGIELFKIHFAYEYVIHDHYGNLIDPKRIVDAYLDRHPKHNPNDRPGYLLYNPGSKKSRRQYSRRVRIHRMIRQIHSVCAEDSEPAIRGSVRERYVPWGFDSHREYRKSWKDQRKQQYKNKKDDL